MPSNKKHHYVPQFYLRRFSRDGRSINLYNLRREQTVLRASLKRQCYKNYFYGEDASMESLLAALEADASKLFRVVDKTNSLPPPGSRAHFALIMHVLMQSSRTVYASDALNEISDTLAKHILGPKAEAKGIDLATVRIGIKNMAQHSVVMAMRQCPLLLDLEYKLIINRTDQEFLASDNPVVMYNPFMSFRRYVSNCGIVSKGLQVFFPLDKDKTVLLYDAAVYSVGTARSHLVDLTVPKDVYSVNALQACSARDNLYFVRDNYNVQALHAKVRPFLRQRKAKVDIYPGDWIKDKKRDMLATSKEDIRTDCTFSFIRVRAPAKRWRAVFRKASLQPAAVFRNTDLYEKHEKAQRALKSGTMSFERALEHLREMGIDIGE